MVSCYSRLKSQRESLFVVNDEFTSWTLCSVARALRWPQMTAEVAANVKSCPFADGIYDWYLVDPGH